MKHCDVLVIGGGPAGSALAWGLRDTGLDITIMDKQVFPRNKTCAGWITPNVSDTLRINLKDYARDNTLQPVHGFRVGQIGSGVIEINCGDLPVSYGIRRCELDHFLLQRCGARLLLDTPCKKIQRKNNKWLINDNIVAGLVVGAGGHFCPVARFLGTKRGGTETVVAAQEIEFRMDAQQLKDCNIDPVFPELYFCPDLKGYGWILKKGDYLNIGLGREDRHKLSEHVENFCRFLIEKEKIRFEVTDKFSGHAYLLYQHSTRPRMENGMLLIGDAAGLAYTQSGEGIRPAIESGLMAAEVIRAANGDYNLEKLAGYEDLIDKRFGRRKTRSNLMPALPDTIKQYLAKKIMKSHWFVRTILINRWFLHSDQPPLVGV